MDGQLFIVATPIGNLEDISKRALRILEEADIIFCEDTRVTSKILHVYGIQTSLKSYHAQSKPAVLDGIIRELHAGNIMGAEHQQSYLCLYIQYVVLQKEIR